MTPLEVLHERQRSESATPTKRVRICVAIAPDGKYSVQACDDGDEDDAIMWAKSLIDSDQIDIHFITADIPLPGPPTEIEGAVEATPPAPPTPPESP